MLKIRGTDDYGSGHYGASRGDHAHNGVDLRFVRGETAICFEDGKHTKLGKPYYSEEHPEKNHYRYVEVTVADGNRHRYFYCNSLPAIDDIVEKGDIIGWVQGIEESYPGITPHIHFEIMKPDGGFIDPVKYLKGLGYEFSEDI